MPRLILSLALIALAGSAIVSTTRAWFTDRSTVANNTLATATLDFHLSGDMTETKSVGVTNLAPGQWTDEYKMDIYNEKSTVPIKYRFYDANATESVGGLYGKLLAKVVNYHCGGADYNTWTGKLSDLDWNSVTSPSVSTQLNPNLTHCFRISFGLDSSAGNTYQNQSAKFDLVVDGTQVSNPGWTE